VVGNLDVPCGRDCVAAPRIEFLIILRLGSVVAKILVFLFFYTGTFI
jgi:hypothetical protein